MRPCPRPHHTHRTSPRGVHAHGCLDPRPHRERRWRRGAGAAAVEPLRRFVDVAAVATGRATFYNTLAEQVLAIRNPGVSSRTAQRYFQRLDSFSSQFTGRGIVVGRPRP